ncbi:MAG: hypothetical protein IMZ44_03385 [Planctomycetes bacterium]|nr:hypothetical protein [Planctomycetota bacterium]
MMRIVAITFLAAGLLLADTALRRGLSNEALSVFLVDSHLAAEAPAARPSPLNWLLGGIDTATKAISFSAVWQ